MITYIKITTDETPIPNYSGRTFFNKHGSCCIVKDQVLTESGQLMILSDANIWYKL